MFLQSTIMAGKKLTAREIKNIVRKAKQHGITPLSNSATIVRTRRSPLAPKRNVMKYFQQATSFYKYHEESEKKS